ncbi:Peptidyl-dipeptidase A [Pseudoalteromonas carrageenovora]|uniref:Peptidyl-dipeptidase n=1 Tax=Pseudoalteromonas carrageenovora IAM 12662 TaxID=1314868 RepID=A0A2K4XAF2_PSEVC|nr:M2 family metallopeptidase [Pseudoalteromonas carrageenovora]MBE0384047.1 peptidyl-dipeptidase A [Pseudoalteromonas carrageenovora IAM 12662]QBJ72192.1 Peptidyl-dipeptidase A [Pseudoalteromonas carrageenovora]GEB72128.1 peptidase M2 [Pseudoalteromonas carrageenovora]SOU41302.1 Peptidyl-dipeptidase [Pseudoalteromonas carrageenovora IAM 12662]
MNTPRFKLSMSALVVASTLALSACDAQVTLDTSDSSQATKTVTAKDANAFITKTEQELSALYLESSRAEWIYANFITHDTSALSAEVNRKMTETVVRLANQAAQFDELELDYDARRKLNKLKLALTLPAPQDAEKTAQLSTIVAELGGLYGKGKYCKDDGSCLSLGDMTAKMATSRDYNELLDLWQGWRQISKPMRPLYEQQVALTNEGAKELGYADTGAMWRSKYDMPADDFTKELDRIWGQVKPLYNSLHCHVRAKLGEKYGTDKVVQDEPIPAHLLGNMWAQAWGNIYDVVAPENADPGYDVTELLAKNNYDELKMVKGAETFFTSMGFEPLPETFYKRSLFIKPKDRDVQCHASAWNINSKDDLRIKMCIQRTGEEFSVIHHELGHNFYQRAYNKQPLFYQESANDGFHEAIGDTIALSVTPGYLKEIGLLEQVPDESKDIGLLMKMALDKVAFVPFSLMVDQWRWQVFSGQVKPQDYNKAWWELREKYQGVQAPIARSEDDFDPGAKYHVPGNTPYTRYFLAHILQFEFHRSLCEIAGNDKAIHRCSIYNSEEAGDKLNTMLEMGSSRPWQEALEAVTGKPQMDATAMLDYFAPLQRYLDEQNKGRNCGW